MSHFDWLVSTDIQRMIQHACHFPRWLTARKLRLFVCGCARLAWSYLSDRRSRHAIEVAERHADEGVAGGMLAAVRRDADAVALAQFRPRGSYGAADVAPFAASGETGRWTSS